MRPPVGSCAFLSQQTKAISWYSLGFHITAKMNIYAFSHNPPSLLFNHMHNLTLLPPFIL
jgi:hypothetical protein